ncbi:hypothetical protein Hypma_011070 [Hypsizygus marmoreus]|uniref:Uncharacterized protein n=1 Tax=Hypsizygus marmoreus TaxID=39966 RepID=A0A369JI13_HYPMA|nr:hypothetical protein Hypma_011070 [Hypsizygus marmoreus]
MIKALYLRSVGIWDFSRIDFDYTVLSKRKLQKFIDKGLVHGRDDSLLSYCSRNSATWYGHGSSPTVHVTAGSIAVLTHPGAGLNYGR